MNGLHFGFAVWLVAIAGAIALLWLERARIGPHIPNFVAAWHWSKGKRLHVLAAVFAGGEAIVMCGVPLPYSDVIDQRLRVLIIGAIVGLAYYLRWRADQEPADA